MKVVIIEDEKPSARRLGRMLESQDVEVEVMLHSVQESIGWFQANKHPDLIFLDIQLNDGLSFEIFEKVELKSSIIFTTAYDEYALKAFKYNSIDYLLKPIDEVELKDSIEKYRNLQYSRSIVNIDFDDIKRLLVNPLDREFKKRYSVKIGQHLKLINTEDIECFYSENKGTYAHTIDGRDYIIDSTMELLSTELDPDKFFRVNRAHYINIDYIKDMLSYSNSRLQVKLTNYKDSAIIVARERVKEFKEWLE